MLLSAKPSFEAVGLYIVVSKVPDKTGDPNASVNAEVDVATLMPSEAVNVSENVPACAAVDEGVTVNTLAD
jgi:hypothetical protein